MLEAKSKKWYNFRRIKCIFPKKKKLLRRVNEPSKEKHTSFVNDTNQIN
jgi:hypothetical protein